MEINEKVVRELKKKFEIEMNRREAEIIEYWRKEIELIYKKKYENLSSMQTDIKNMMERMNNRVSMISRMAKEGV
jgi:sulfur relay (sulfurtransferase) DsrC/TusE family protein